MDRSGLIGVGLAVLVETAEGLEEEGTKSEGVGFVSTSVNASNASNLLVDVMVEKVVAGVTILVVDFGESIDSKSMFLFVGMVFEAVDRTFIESKSMLPPPVECDDFIVRFGV